MLGNTSSETRKPGAACAHSGRQSRGFSYVEVLVATILIAIVLVPALEALHSGIQGSGIHASRSRDHFRLVGKLEEVLAKPFDVLSEQADTTGGVSVPVSLLSDSAGSVGRLLVYLAHYDADAKTLSGSATGLILVRVSIEGSNDVLTTLTRSEP